MISKRQDTLSATQKLWKGYRAFVLHLSQVVSLQVMARAIIIFTNIQTMGNNIIGQ